MNKITFTLCADDYAQHDGIDQAVCALLAQQRLSAVSCMTGSPRWPTNAPRLLDFQDVADFGLHFNLTENFGNKAVNYSLPSLIRQAYLRQVNATTLEMQFQRQCDAFEQSMKQAPTFIDGHQHVHQLPIIRHIMQKVLTHRYGNKLPWVRNTVPISTHLGGKALLLKLLGGVTLKKQLRQNKIRSNSGFLGVYDFHTLNYAALFECWLQHIQISGQSNALLMCHPASYFSVPDEIGPARMVEFRFFNSPAFPVLLQKYQLAIKRLSETIINVPT
jgi:predicted glycoside hydrolase/deacetylase ChbG (UPF0249 family)